MNKEKEVKILYKTGYRVAKLVFAALTWLYSSLVVAPISVLVFDIARGPKSVPGWWLIAGAILYFISLYLLVSLVFWYILKKRKWGNGL